MSNMLQFKMGQFAGLAGQGIAPGTVYVTTDEKALYVDIPANGDQAAKRIRMGDVIQVENVAELQSFAPDYSTTALYYVICKNALMKYTGNGTEHSWKQINSIEAVDNLIKEVDKKVDDLTDVVNTNTAAIGKASAEGQAATGLFARVEALEAEDVALDGRLDVVEPKVTTLVGQVGAKAADDTSEATLFERVAANKGAIADVKATADANESAITGLATTVGDASKGLVKDVADLKAADTAMGTRVDGIEARVEANETAIGTKAAEDTNTKSLYARVYDNQKAAAAAQTKADANESAITGLSGRMDTAEADIDQLQLDVDAVELALGAKTDTADAEGSAFARIAQNVADITALAGRVGTAEKDIDDLQETVRGIGDNANAIAGINAKLAGIGEGETVKGLITSLETDLKAEIDKDINAANAMNFIKGIEEYAELPTADVHVGDTYVVLIGFNQVIGEETVRFNAGDLLVATGTEENGVITSGLAWNHVRTGYVDAHEASLSGVDNKIKLTSHLGADLGQVEFASANENLKVSVANNKVTVGLEWGTF